jgi:hypothetical protein
LLVAVSTYSVAIKQLPSLAWYHQSQQIKYVLIATVWVIGCILSLHHAHIAHIENETCKGVSLDRSVPVHTADLITFCGVPLHITAILTGVTAYGIQRSVRRIPGE